MYYSQTARLAIYAQGEFGRHSKTAEGVIRYGKHQVVAVIDSLHAGKTVRDVTGIPQDIPIVSTLAQTLPFKPDALLLGTAWTGGHLPAAWREDIISALTNGLDVINGLHDFLADDPEIAAIARQHKRKLLDVRRPPDGLPVGDGRALAVDANVVLTVGSDCSVGKMTVALELTAAAQRQGRSAQFIATGQTGIMICGQGIAIDRVIGDFMSGAVEKMVVEAAPGNDWLFVEGQGSLVHPGFSGVTLSLLHGSCPHAMILCHKPSRTVINESHFAIPDYKRLIDIYESMAACLRPARIAGIALNTRDLDETRAKEAINEAERKTGLPVTDPVRFGADKLFEAVVAVRGLVH